MQLAKFKGANAFCLFRCVWSCLVLLARPVRGGSFVSPVKGLSKRWRCWHSSQAKRSEAKPSQAPYRHELKRGSCSVGSRLCWVDWLPSVFLTVFWPGTATTTTTTTTATGSQVVCCSAHLFDHLLGQWQRVNLCSGNHCDSDTADYRWTRDTKTKQGRHESDADRGKLDYASELYFLPSMHSFLAPSLHFL